MDLSSGRKVLRKDSGWPDLQTNHCAKTIKGSDFPDKDVFRERRKQLTQRKEQILDKAKTNIHWKVLKQYFLLLV